jgi:PAS domain S-box-containing protein
MTEADICKQDIGIVKVEENGELVQAFHSFNDAAHQLSHLYASLKKEIYELNLELDRKNRELQSNLQAKERSNDYLDNILKSLNVGVMVFDRRQKITTFNRAAELLTGLASERVINEELPRLKNCELVQKILDGLENSGIERCNETEVTTPGCNPRHLTLSFSSLRNKHNEVVGSVVILEDITRLKRLEEQARRTDRLAAMGEIAAKIAHEIRNPLGSIELCASSLKKKLGPAGFDSTLLDQVLHGVNDLKNVVSNMLLFTKSPQPSLEEVDLAVVIDESLRLAHYLFEQNGVELSVRYDPRPLIIQSDRELLIQLFLNLILNAAQAMPDGGKLAVSALAPESGAHYRSKFRSWNLTQKKCVGDWIEIKIKDTGCGIAKEDRAKIFDPFFTTRERGTGLGLAIVHNIVERLKGFVELESAPQKGTTFSVTLPRKVVAKPEPLGAHQ